MFSDRASNLLGKFRKHGSAYRSIIFADLAEPGLNRTDKFCSRLPEHLRESLNPDTLINRKPMFLQPRLHWLADCYLTTAARICGSSVSGESR